MNKLVRTSTGNLVIAKKILERHTLLSDWLIRLGVSEKTFKILKEHCLKVISNSPSV